MSEAQAKHLKVTGVELVAGGDDCEYRIVELNEGDRYAFVWGNIESDTDDYLDPDFCGDGATAEKGFEICESWQDALDAWEGCAEALADVYENDPAAAEMLRLAELNRE